MSAATSGSAPSLMVTPAVVWGTKTWHSPSATPDFATASATRSVMSMRSARLREVTWKVTHAMLRNSLPGGPVGYFCTCMQLQSSVSAWLGSADDESQADSRQRTPDLSDFISEMDERPKVPAEPGQASDTDDSLGAYLREIGRGTLLTKEQEVELAKLIEAGSDDAR